MFETSRFRDRLTAITQEEAAARGLTEYETEAVTYLQQLATGNEGVLMEREMQKSASLRRGLPEAESSARVILGDASDIARADGRTLLKVADVQAA